MQASSSPKKEATTPPQQRKKSRPFKLFRASLGQGQKVGRTVLSAPKRFGLVIQKDRTETRRKRETQIFRIGEDYFWAQISRMGTDKLL